jgi:putative FmdB family regulatory protein
MPLFEFVCRECGHRFEAIVLGSRVPICPSCAATNLEKLISTPGALTTSARASSRQMSAFT